MSHKRKRENDLGRLISEGVIGAAVPGSDEWELAMNLASGKMDKVITNGKDREALLEFLNDDLTMMVEAAKLSKSNPKIKTAYRGRLMDLVSDLYEKTREKAEDEELKPILEKVIKKSKSYVSTEEKGQDVLGGN